MTRKKLKITIECEGQNTQTFEANGMAAAFLTDGSDSNHHSLKCLICGNMNVQDLIHLHDGVEDELTNQLETAITDNLSPVDLLKIILGGRKRGSDR